ncbi:TPA: O27 family O-antigen flippase, partial [Escherichia coli]|nr:O27 family O-antigen flippase [Escherichia coli]
MKNYLKITINNKVFSNSIWMILEKIISVFGLLFVTSYVAKYIGPSNFGILTYVASIFIIAQALSTFGSEHVLFKRIAKNRKSGINLMMSTSYLRHLVFISLSIGILCYLWVSSDQLTFTFGVATAVAYYFSAIDVFSVYNNAVLNSKLNTYCNITGLLISLIVRYIIAHYELDIRYLCIPIILVTCIPFAMKVYLYHSKKFNFQPRIDKKRYGKYLIKTGTPLAFSTVSAIIYTRVTLFFIMAYCGPTELGIFSVASQLATSWMFITSAFITSYFTKIYTEKDESIALIQAAKLNGSVLFCAIIVILILVLIGKKLILTLYGVAYLQAYDVMLILCINTLFSCMGPVASKFIIFKSGFSFLSLKMMLTMLLSIPSAYFLTKEYGIYGAAISTIITEFLSLTLMNYLFRNGIIFKLHYKMFFINTYAR